MRIPSVMFLGCGDSKGAVDISCAEVLEGPSAAVNTVRHPAQGDGRNSYVVAILSSRPPPRACNCDNRI